MTDEMLAKATGPILHFPTVLGAVVPVYNIEGLKTQIKFTGPVIADIFLGKIKKWNDPAIVKINSGVSLPSTDITVAHRSDGSGTTFVFADYLSKISPEWKQKVGANSSLNWPVGVGGKGNEGVAGLVTQTPGSLGYVELVYALQNKISYGAVQNQSRRVHRSRRDLGYRGCCRRDADDAERLPRVDHELAWPGRVSHLVVHLDSASTKIRRIRMQAKVMNDFMKWALNEGQPMAGDLGYARLPEALVPLGARAVEPD